MPMGLRLGLSISPMRIGGAIQPQPITISPWYLDATGEVYQPTVSVAPEGLTVSPSFLSATGSVYSPTVSVASGPTYVGAGAVNRTTGTGSISIALPSGLAENDVMVLITGKFNTQVVSTPSGWTAVGTSPNGLDVFRKVAGSSESAPSISSTGGISGIILAYRGINTTTPVDVSAEATATGTFASFPSATTTVANCPVVMAVAQNGLRTFTPGSGANLSDYTEVLDDQTDGALDFTLAVYRGTKATAGSTGNPAATGSGSDNYGSMTIALKPA